MFLFVVCVCVFVTGSQHSRYGYYIRSDLVAHLTGGNLMHTLNANGGGRGGVAGTLVHLYGGSLGDAGWRHMLILYIYI